MSVEWTGLDYGRLL